MKKSILSIFLLQLFMTSQASIEYRVSFPEATKHYVHVEIEIPSSLAKKHDSLIFSIPVWTPGSYKVREFSRNVDRISAASKGNACPIKQIDKNNWLVTDKNKSSLTISYDVYAFEYGVRESYVDLDFAFLHGPSTFGYIKGLENEEIKLIVDLPKDWANIHVALPSKGKNEYLCTNYDLLADSPMALGNFDHTSYESGGVEHQIVMIGAGSYDLIRVAEDFKKISDAQVEIFNGTHPSTPLYIHFIQHIDAGGGGLEHTNCQTSQVNRFVYSNEAEYLKFLGLIAHEYFHLWNVKRIRPIELGPFDYDKEVYTEMLWVAEGITSYYDDLILRKAGLHTNESYLKELAANINRFENQEGRKYMSLHQSSFNAWIRGYLPNENSKNVTVSYYNKGMLVAWMLDQKIREYSMGKKNMDDLLRLLYDRFYIKANRGFTHEEFMAACSEVAEFDLKQFFQNYVFGTKTLEYAEILKYSGLQLVEADTTTKCYMGCNVKKEGNNTILTYVEFDSPCEQAGLSTNDELISLDGFRINTDLSQELKRFNPGQSIQIIYSRKGVIKQTELILVKDPTARFEIKPMDSQTELQKFHFETWMN